MKIRQLLNHIQEIRRRILYCLLVVLSLFIILAFYANSLYHILAIPLLKQLPEQQALLAIGVATPWIAPLKLALFTALFLTMPFILHQLWCFLAPGLYKNEKRFLVYLLLTSSALFYFGVAFCYLLVFPMLFSFLGQTIPPQVNYMPDLNYYLSFCLQLFFAFGLAFEVPIIVLVLIKTGVCTYSQLKRARAYIFVLAFTVGMLLTPPDVISQVLLAIPIYLLYELGLILSKRLGGVDNSLV